MNRLQYDFLDIHTLSECDLRSTLELMTEQRKNRILGFPDENNRLRSIAAEYLVRSMISHRFSIPAEGIIIDQHASGKPFVRSLPCHISLSHSGKYAMAAVNDRPVGADIEIITDRGERLISKVCSEGEQEYILASGSFDPQRFFTVWTAKEAVLKHSGKGLSGGLAATIVADRSGVFPALDGHQLISGLFRGAAFSIYT